MQFVFRDPAGKWLTPLMMHSVSKTPEPSPALQKQVANKWKLSTVKMKNAALAKPDNIITPNQSNLVNQGTQTDTILNNTAMSRKKSKRKITNNSAHPFSPVSRDQSNQSTENIPNTNSPGSNC